MDQNHPNLNEVLKSPQASNLLKNKQAIESLMKSAEAQKLMELLNRNSGESLKNAAQSAMSGDSKQLMSMVRNLMSDPNNVKLIEDLNKKIK